jgi:uroporphyrinogen-III synthase
MPETVAFFRPDDDRAAAAAAILRDLGVDPLSDPMLAVDPTGETPRTDAAVTVLTSKTGVDLASRAGWRPDGAVVAIGTATADALESHGFPVDMVPQEYSSAGIVEAVGDEVDGRRVEVARSDHGSAVLTDGLDAAGAYVHETVLYRLTRPEAAGRSTELAAEGRLDGACFTSSLTVKHFLEAATARGVRADAVAGLEEAVVGAIGDPTRETATAHDIAVDVVSPTAEFEALARAVVGRL